MYKLDLNPIHFFSKSYWIVIMHHEHWGDNGYRRGERKRREKICQFNGEKLIFYWLSSIAWWQYRKFSIRIIDLFNLMWKCLHDKHTGMPRFIMLHFIALGRYCAFYKSKVCGNPVRSTSIGTIFPAAFAHFMSLCHILVTLAIFQIFSLLLYLLWWSVISDFYVTIVLFWSAHIKWQT